MHKIELNINFLDIVEQIWKQETKDFQGTQYDEDEDVLYHIVDIGDYDSRYVKSKLLANKRKEKILKALWLLKENL